MNDATEMDAAARKEMNTSSSQAFSFEPTTSQPKTVTVNVTPTPTVLKTTLTTLTLPTTTTYATTSISLVDSTCLNACQMKLGACTLSLGYTEPSGVVLGNRCTCNNDVRPDPVTSCGAVFCPNQIAHVKIATDSIGPVTTTSPALCATDLGGAVSAVVPAGIGGVR